MLEVLLGAAKGALYGATAAAIGYLKTDPLEQFDPRKFTKTVFIGSVLGACTGAGIPIPEAAELISTQTGIPAQVIEAGLMTGLTMLADQLVKLLYGKARSAVRMLRK